VSLAVAFVLVLLGCSRRPAEAPSPTPQPTPPAAAKPGRAAWEAENPLRPIPEPPLGITTRLTDLPDPPTPERVRLGRWLFYDTRLSADGTLACATCHRPENAFSEPTPTSTGIRGQVGKRKAPTILNGAFPLYPVYFWDGRAASLEEQAKGPVANPIEMGNSHETMVATLQGVAGYAPYFEEAFGTPEITLDRVAKAIADFERTRMSGSSLYDRWQADETGSVTLPALVEQGRALFFGKAQCNLCHLGESFTDSQFHVLGVGWDEAARQHADVGRYEVTKVEKDRGAFKTPTLRDVTKHSPYMHDGSIPTLRAVIEHYNKGGNPNPQLSDRIKPLGLTDADIDAVVAFMGALDGEGWQDTPPATFPR
jgi:cytochrome c peroxidase